MTMPPTVEQSTRPLNPLAVVSLVASLVPFLQLVGVITGHIALVQIKRGATRGRGLALAGVIIGYAGLALTGVLIAVSILAAIALPVAFSQQTNTHDSAVQLDIVNAKIAVITFILEDPSGFPALSDLTELVIAPDTRLTLSGGAMGFCIEGYSLANGETAVHYAASDVSATVEGTCDAGRLVPAH